MYLVPHSYPNIDEQDFNYVRECLELEFVGFDNNLERKYIIYF